MLISHAVYEVFYILLRDRFIQNVLGGKLAEQGMTVLSPAIWDTTLEKGKNNQVSLRLFGGGRSADPRYFYRKYSEIQRRPQIHVDDVALYKAFLYLNGTHKGEHDNGKTNVSPPFNLKVELDALYDDFTIHYQKEILEVAVSDKNPVTQLPLSDEERQQLKGVVETTEEMINNDVEAVKGVVNKYYDSVAIKALPQAWELLSPNFRKRVWQDVYDRFAEGYVNTRGIRGISVSSFKQSSSFIIDCVVSYEDEIEAYSSLELDALNGTTVKNLDDFVRLIKVIQVAVENAGGTGFEKIELCRFFDPAASEYIWFKCGVQPDKLDMVFDRSKTIFVKRNYLCSCHFVDGQWLIERIRALSTYSTR